MSLLLTSQRSFETVSVFSFLFPLRLRGPGGPSLLGHRIGSVRESLGSGLVRQECLTHVMKHSGSLFSHLIDLILKFELQGRVLDSPGPLEALVDPSIREVVFDEAADEGVLEFRLEIAVI